MTAELQKLAAYLRASDRIMTFTGAGISTGSGIPDFRGPNGVWKRRQPVYYQDFMTSESARVEHWDYKLEAWPAFRAARPNPVHHAIVALENAGKVSAVLTQNIDGLHALAGSDSRRLIELHGTNLFVECQTCLWRGDPEPHFEHFRIHRKPPLCECGGYLKPATISFGQNLDPLALKRAGELSGRLHLRGPGGSARRHGGRDRRQRAQRFPDSPFHRRQDARSADDELSQRRAGCAVVAEELQGGRRDTSAARVDMDRGRQSDRGIPGAEVQD